jgi:hypothetical protein
MCRKLISEGQKIAHAEIFFYFGVQSLRKAPPCPLQGQLLLIFQPDRRSDARVSGAHQLRKITSNKGKSRHPRINSNAHAPRTETETQTATVKVSSLRVTARYIVSRSNGSRPASVISRTRSARRMPCGVVAPASW